MEVWGLLSARGAGLPAAQVTGKLEVIGTEGGIVKESRLSVKRLNPAEKADAFKVSADCLKGKLQVLGPNEEVPRLLIDPPNSAGSVGSRHVSPKKKVYTPTKQISLCTARAYPDLNDTSTRPLVDKKPAWSSAPNSRSSSRKSENTDENTSSIKKTSSSQTVIDNHNSKKEKEGSTDDDDSDTDDSGDDRDEKVRAPLELMAEFLKALMDRDYVLSSKLVEMILIYEPENAEAQQFLPLIKEKILIDENERNAATEDEETDEDSSESEDSTDDSDSDSDDNSTEAYCSSSGAEDGI